MFLSLIRSCVHLADYTVYDIFTLMPGTHLIISSQLDIVFPSSGETRVFTARPSQETKLNKITQLSLSLSAFNQIKLKHSVLIEERFEGLKCWNEEITF